VDLAFAVDLDGRMALSAAQMEQALRSALARAIQRARAAPSSEPVITEHAAWFPNEAAAIGELIAAHAEGRASAWPFRALTLWGATPTEILRACLARERALLGDVLAAAILRLDAGVFSGLFGDELAASVVATCTEGPDDRAIGASALPPDLRAAVAAEIARLSSASPAARDLVALARLFALWPPARDARIPLVELRLIAGVSPASTEAPPREVLAELLRGTPAAELVGELPADVVEALVALLRGSRESRDAVLASLRALLEGGEGGEARDLALASLVAPLEGGEARDLALASLMARLEKEGIVTAALRHAVLGARTKRLVSAAGGLVAWATLFAAEGLSEEIDDAYPEPRAQRAVRWAVGAALDDARIGGLDPILLVWSGEDVAAMIDPGLGLAIADAEILHARALRIAVRRGLLQTPLDAARFGDTVTLTGPSGFCVDAVVGDDVNRAIPELVRRFTRRVGAPPPGARVAPRMSGEAVDALVEVDVPPLPEPWRMAVRAFASLARSALLERWRAPVRDLRRWPAIVEMGRAVAVELSRSDISRVGAGGWLRGSVRMGGREVILREK
jgi:hypothetical protein